MKSHVRFLKTLDACDDAVEYADRFDTLEAAWNACERGDWMLWLVGKLSGPVGSDSRKKLVSVACQCARLALQYVEDGEARPLRAIETAEKYVHGDATLDEVLAHAFDASDASASSHASASADASASAYAAAATAACSVCADSVSDAASCAASAAYTVSSAARLTILLECTNIVRERYTFDELAIGIA